MFKTIMAPLTLLSFFAVVLASVLSVLGTLFSLVTFNIGDATENAFQPVLLFAAAVGLLYSLKRLAEDKY